jgi:SAM-dependent methyltransferase
MSFAVPADAYDRFMGRYSQGLAPLLTDFAGVRRRQRALDVGCGPGALTAELVARLGTDAVAAVDPSEPFVAAARERYPDVDIRRAAAEKLPFSDSEFDVVLACLVVHFMADPVAGLREMARVARAGSVVAACVWDHAGDRGPLSVYWTAVRQLDPEAADESRLAGAREGHLGELFAAAGFGTVEEGDLGVSVEYASFDEWWEPYLLGVGPAGAYVAGLEPGRRDELRQTCRRLLPPAPFTVEAHAWAVRGVASG